MIFCCLTSKNSKELKFWKKWKKNCWRYYTCIPKITIIWCTVPEIQSETGKFFCNFWLFFALSVPWQPRKSQFWRIVRNTWRYYHFTHAHPKRQSYDVWFLKYGVRQTEFFVILDQFLSFYPPMGTENQNFEKNRPKILPFHTCVLQMTIICMFPQIWNATDRILDQFLPFYLPPYGPRKSKFWKHENNAWRYYHFTNVYHKWQSYDV